jgi:hypothetical protein
MAKYKYIAGTTLASNNSVISFTSIPQTYTDLVIKLSGKSNINGDGDGVRLTINGTDLNPTGKGIRFFGSGNPGFSGGDNLNTAYVPGSGSGMLSTMFGVHEFYFPEYTSSSSKMILTEGASEKNGNTALYMYSVLNHPTTSGITSISIGNFDSGGTQWVAGSKAYLYGI